MTKKYCDRCGKEIPKDQGIAEIKLTLKVRVTFEKVEELDLCPECGRLFREWLGVK